MPRRRQRHRQRQQQASREQRQPAPQQASQEHRPQAVSKGPTVKVLTAPTTLPSPTRWTVDSVRSAIDAHERGDFSQSSRLATSFGRDDRITPCADDRINALVGKGAADFSLQPNDGPFSSRSKATLSRLDWWWETVTSSWMRRTLREVIYLGFSLSYIPWLRTSRQWIPQRPIHWDPENVYWSESDKLYIANTVEGPHPVHPDDPNWFLITPGGEQSWMAGAVRALGLPFLMRTWDWRDWARFNERHGLPIIVIREPSGSGKPEEKLAFYRDLKRMGSNGIIRAPQGDSDADSYGVDLKEAKARSHDSFDKLLDKLNTAIAIFLKGQNLTTEVQAGAYASTGWHMRVRADYAENDADAFSEALRQQLIIPWGRFNVSSWDDRIAAWPTWDLTIPEDKASQGDGWLKAAQTIEILQRTGAPIDWDLLLPKMDLPIKQGQQMPSMGGSSSGTAEE